MRAKITFRSNNNKEAEAIASALNPDNHQKTQGMKISTKSRGSRVVTEIEFSGRIQTVIATIDDLLKCAQAAERALEPVSKN